MNPQVNKITPTKNIHAQAGILNTINKPPATTMIKPTTVGGL